MLRLLRLNLIIVLTTIATLASFAKGDADSLFTLIKIFAIENPETAGIYCSRLATLANRSANDSLKILYYLAMSEYSSGLGLSENSSKYLDSALKTAQLKSLLNLQVESLLLKSKQLLKTGNYSESIKVNEKARLLALRSKETSLIVKSILSRGDIYKEIGQYHVAIEKKSEAIGFSTKHQSTIAECYQSIGSTHWHFGNYPEALKAYYQGLIAAENASDTLRLIQISKNIGLTFRETGDFDKALENLNSALLYAQKTDNKAEIADILNVFGGVYLKFSRPANAIAYYNQSLAIREKLGYLHSSISSLTNLARAFVQIKKPENAVEALDKALEISRKLNDTSLEANLQNEMGNIYLNLENYSEALRHYLISLKIRQSYGKDEDVARSMVNIALVYRKLGLYRNARKYIEDARKTIENIEAKPDLKIYIYQNLGNVLYDQKEYDKAIGAYQKALELSEQKGDDLQISRLLKNISQSYLDWGKISLARSTISQSIKIALRNNQINELADQYNTLGNIEKQAGNYQLAIAHYARAAEKYQQSLNLDGKALCLRKTGEIYGILGNSKEAESYIKESIKIGEQTKNPYLISLGLLSLSELSKKQGNFAKALALYQKHIRIRDSLDNIKRSEVNLEAHINLELDKTKSEIKLIEAEVEALRARVELDKERMGKQRAQRNLLILVVVFMVFVTATALYLFRQKKYYAKLQRDKYEEVSLINEMLKESQAELQQTIKTKDKLFSIVAHDLRSPFTALVGLTEVLSTNSESLSPQEVKELSEHVHQSATQVLTLTENLLSWARSQTGKLTLKPEPININALINSSVAVASIPAVKKNITINIENSGEPMVFADYETVQTIIRNLLSNAIKFTPEGGIISIRIREGNSSVKVSISDTGIGIAPENLQKLFALDGYTTKGTNSENGTGLGLILCKEFAHANGGTIEVESEVNKGTTFTLTLPRNS